MATSQQIVLHVGAHKTASSLVQRALLLHDDALRAADLAVVHRSAILDSTFGTTLRELVVSGEVPDREATDAARASLAELVDQPQRTVLLTNEDMLEAFRKPSFYEHIAPALRWIQSLTERELGLLLYTRAQVDYIESMYMQRIHLGDSVPFARVRKRYEAMDLSWTRVVDDAAEVIGADHVHVFPYESIKRIGSAGYYANFLTACGVAPDDIPEFPQEIVTSRAANRSYSAEAMKIAMAVNPLLDADGRGQLRRFLQENYSTATHPRATLFGPPGRKRVTERYAGANAELFERWMPEWVADSAPYGIDLLGTAQHVRSATATDRVDAPTPPATAGTGAAVRPVVDVLIPHYEDVQGLAVSLESVAAQEWGGRLRVVVADDGSGADTFAAVRDLASGQPFPVALERMEQNRGRPFARNVLLRAVDAPYLAWLDAGEIWYPEKLATQFEHLRRLEVEGADLDRVWVTCHYDWLQHGEVRRVLQRTTSDQLFDLLIGDKLRAYLWTLLGRTSAFRAAGMFDERLARLQDLDYFIRFITSGGELSAPPSRDALCQYDKSDLGRKHDEVARCSRLIMRKHHRAYAQYGPGFVARSRWKYAKLSARYALNNKSYGAAFGYLGTGALRDPRYVAYRARRKLVGA